MRFSAHGLTLLWAGLFIFLAAQVGDGASFITTSVGIALASMLTLWIVETAPRLNLRVRSGRFPALVGGGVGLVLISVIAVITTMVLGSSVERYQSVFVATLANTFLAWAVVPQLKGRWFVASVLVGLNFCLGLWVGIGDQWTFLLFTFGLFLTMVFSEWTVEVIKELDQAKATEAALSANDERLRIAQQLHDSLGQSLAAMNLKVQVIDKLLASQRNPEPALTAEVQQLKTLLRETSTHMREVVHGYRKIDMRTEFRNARQLLEAAGIIVHEKGNISAVGELTESEDQAAGWFFREVSTNIMRHSQAAEVEISWASGYIRIANDGVNRPAGILGGLDTLQQRARKDGGRITAQQNGNRFITSLDFGGRG